MTQICAKRADGFGFAELIVVPAIAAGRTALAAPAYDGAIGRAMAAPAMGVGAFRMDC